MGRIADSLPGSGHDRTDTTITANRIVRLIVLGSFSFTD